MVKRFEQQIKQLKKIPMYKTHLTCLFSIFLSCTFSSSEATSIQWGGTGSTTTTPDLALNTNWESNTLPGPGDLGLFFDTGNHSPTLNTTVTPGGYADIGSAAPFTFTIGLNGYIQYMVGGFDSSGTTVYTFNLINNGRIDFNNSASAANFRTAAYNLSDSSLLVFNQTSTPGVATFNFNSTATSIRFLNSSNTTIPNAITGTTGNSNLTSGVFLSGSAPNTIFSFTGSGVKTYSGQTGINVGTLQAGSTNAFSANSDIVMNGSNTTLDLNNNDNTIGSLASTFGTSLVTLGSGTLTLGGTNASTTYAGAITGTGVLSKNGTGIFILSGSGLNIYSGATKVNTGTLQSGAVNSFSPNSTVQLFGNAILDLNNNNNVIGSLDSGVTTTRVNLRTGTLTTGGDNSSTSYAGTITGNGGGLTKNGTGIFSLNGTANGNTYTGQTTINAGTLRAQTTNVLSPSSAVVMTGSGILNIASNNVIGSLTGTATNSVTINNGVFLTTGNDNTSTTFAGAITGAVGQLIKIGTGVFTLSGSNLNTYGGSTEVRAGTLQSGATNGLPVNSAIILENSAILDLNNFNNTILSLNGTTGNLVTLGSGTLTLLNPFPTTYSGAITGTGGLTKNGSGTFTLSGSGLSTYSGVTTINAGRLQSGATNSFSASSAVVMTGTSTLDLNNFNNTIASLTGTSGNLVSLVGGTLTTGNGTSTTYAGAITGTGNLIKNGLGTFTLSGSGLNTYSGTTTINRGVLQAGAINSFSSVSDVVMTDSATLDLNNFDNTIGSLTGLSSNLVTLGSGTLTTGNTLNTTFAGAITGTGGLTKNGSGTFTLSGASLNTYSGTTTINAGTLQSGALNSLSANSAVVMNGSSVLDLNSNNNTIVSLTGGASNSVLLENGVLTVQNPVSTTYSGSISGTALGGLTKNGLGVFTLGGSGLATYSGPTTINGGTLQAGALNSFAPNSAVLMTGNSILDLNNFNNTIGSLTGTATNRVTLGSATLTTGGDNTSTLYAGAIVGTGGLTKNGTGTFTLSGSNLNTYVGDTNINSGTLASGADNSFSSVSNVNLAGGATLDSGAFTNTIGALTSAAGGIVNINAPGILTFGNSTSTSIAGAFTGTGDLHTQGSGSISYTGNSPGFTGTTTIANPIFALNGLLGGNAIVSGGSTLSGNGTIGGNLTVNNGATISPGNNSIGTMTVNGNYIQNANSTYVVEINGAMQSDLINVGGTATLNGGTVQVIPLGGYNVNHEYLILSTGGGVTGTFQNVIAAPLGSTLLNPTLIYTPTQVFLEIQTAIVNAACTNNNAIALAIDNIQDPSPELNLFLNRLLALSNADICSVLDQLSGQQYTLAFVAAESNSRQFLRRLYDPLRLIVTEIASCDTCTCYPCNSNATFTPWIEGGAGRTIIQGNHNVKGLNLNNYQVSGGFQGTKGEVTLGIAGSYDHDNIDYRFNGSGKSDTGYGALYGLYRSPDLSDPCANFSRWYVLGDLAYGYTRNTTKRHVDFSDQHYQMKGKYNMNQVFGYVEAGFDIYAKCLLVQPFVGLEAGSYHRSRIHETGDNPLDLQIKSKTFHNTYSRLGMHMTTDSSYFARNLNQNTWSRLMSKISLSLDLAWSYRWTSNSKYGINENFESFGGNFTVSGIKNGRNSVDGALTLSLDIHDKWQLFAEANGTYWGQSSNYNILGGVTYSW